MGHPELAYFNMYKRQLKYIELSGMEGMPRASWRMLLDMIICSPC